MIKIVLSYENKLKILHSKVNNPYFEQCQHLVAMKTSSHVTMNCCQINVKKVQ